MGTAWLLAVKLVLDPDRPADNRLFLAVRSVRRGCPQLPTATMATALLVPITFCCSLPPWRRSSPRPRWRSLPATSPAARDADPRYAGVGGLCQRLLQHDPMLRRPRSGSASCSPSSAASSTLVLTFTARPGSCAEVQLVRVLLAGPARTSCAVFVTSDQPLRRSRCSSACCSAASDWQTAAHPRFTFGLPARRPDPGDHRASAVAVALRAVGLMVISKRSAAC